MKFFQRFFSVFFPTIFLFIDKAHAGGGLKGLEGLVYIFYALIFCVLAAILYAPSIYLAQKGFEMKSDTRKIWGFIFSLPALVVAIAIIIFSAMSIDSDTPFSKIFTGFIGVSIISVVCLVPFYTNVRYLKKSKNEKNNKS